MQHLSKQFLQSKEAKVMSVVMNEPKIKEEVPFQVIAVPASSEVEIDYQDESISNINDSKGSNITKQSSTESETLESDENELTGHCLHFDGKQSSSNGLESHSDAEANDLENVVQDGTRPSMLFLQDKLRNVIKCRKKAKIIKMKDKNNVTRGIVLPKQEMPPPVKEGIMDAVEGKGCNEFNGNDAPDSPTYIHNNQSSNSIDSRYSSEQPLIYLGPNDSFATITSIASGNSEPIIVVVRNVNSEEPICEPLHMPSSRNVNPKVLVEIQELEKSRNNQVGLKEHFSIASDPKMGLQQTSKSMFPKICLTGTMTFECVVCGLEYSNRKALIEHVKSHSTDKKSFECPTCKKIFTQQCNLKRHMRCHSGERPFSCPYCKKLFADQGYLTTHLRYHTNTKPYTCQHCAKSFFDRSNYVKHLKSHSGEKPYPCSICNKSFLQQSDLTRHTRVHSGERPFKCGFCERSFTQHGDLTTHLRHHTGERPFVCSDCQKTFANKRYLNSHVKGRICFKKKNASLKEIKLVKTLISFETNCQLKKG